MDSSKTPISASAPPVPVQNVTGGAKDVLAEILEWLKERPGWQRERRPVPACCRSCITHPTFKN